MSFSKHIYQSFTWRILYYVSVLLLNICIARYFEASLSGWFNYLMSIAGLLVLISGLSLDSATGYYSTKEDADLTSFAWFILFWCIIVLLLALLTIIILNYGGILSGSLLLPMAIVMYVIGNLAISFTQSVFIAKYNFRTTGIVAVIFNLALLLLLLVMSILKEKMDISFFLSLYAACFLVQGLILWYILFTKYYIKPLKKITLSFIKKLFQYAMPAFAGNLTFFFVYRIDYWFVHKFCDDALLGNYIQVSKLAQLFLIIPAAIAAVIFPATAKGEENIGIKMKALSRVLISCFLFVLALLVLFGKWLFPWLFGNSFDKMYVTFLPLIPGILSLVIISLLGAYFAGKDLVRINLIGALLALIIMVIADLILIPALQIQGAAIACSISYSSYLVYLLFWFSRKESSTISNMFFITKSDWSLFKNMLTSIK